MKKLILILILVPLSGLCQSSQIETIPAIAKAGSNIKDKPGAYGRIIANLEAETPVNVIGVEGNYYKVCIGEKCGYMSEIWIRGNKHVFDLKDEYLEDQKKLKEIEAEEQRQKVQDSRLALEKAMLQKYGKKVFDQMKGGYIWRGMNEEMINFTLGDPIKINKSVGTWGTHEQWVYPNQTYIYFENGKVTSYQFQK